jgi:uncharacterized membrane protein SirB2
MTAFTIFHVVLSLIGIVAGFVVIWGFLTAKGLDVWNAVFLTCTTLTSVTGFFFPIERFTPGLAVGILSLLALCVAVVGRYPMQMHGRWRATYVVTALISQYFNFTVLITQSFQKIPALTTLAPTQSESPFLITQLVALVVFIILGVVALARFHCESISDRRRPANA